MKMNMDGITVTGEAEVLGEQSDPLPLRPTEISNGLAWNRTRVAVVKDRLLAPES